MPVLPADDVDDVRSGVGLVAGEGVHLGVRVLRDGGGVRERFWLGNSVGFGLVMFRDDEGA
ncbi:hypothetical protein [Dermabacter hominis]